MNVYLVTCPDAIIYAQWNTQDAVELVVAATYGKAKSIAHAFCKGYFDFCGAFTDWRAKLIAKDVKMEEGLLPHYHPLWDCEGYEDYPKAATWSNGKDREDLYRASDSYWNEWYSTFEVTYLGRKLRRD